MSNIKVVDVRAVPGDAAFLIDDGTTAVLYDTGFAFTGYRVAENIKNALGNRPLAAILLTHSHYDHALGTPYILKYYPTAKVVAGEYAVGIFQKPSAKRLMRELDRKFADKCGVGEYDDLVDELKVDIAVCDGDTVRFGDMEFTVIDLPGHTRCSVGYYLEAEKLLLNSETLGVFGGEGIVVPSYLIGYQTALDSIKKAQQFDIEQMVVPHYGLLEPQYTKDFLKISYNTSVEVAESICNILQNGGSEDDALEYFRQKFYHGFVRDVYPRDAMELNTSIMIRLIQKELCNNN